MKIEIGSAYEDPTIDRPILRQLPRHWVLEETKVPVWKWVVLWILRVVRG